MTIAEWWQKQRITQGWTQEEAATKLSIDQTTVSSIERERRLPSIRQLRIMLDLIEASPEERAKAWELLAQADALRSAQKDWVYPRDPEIAVPPPDFWCGLPEKGGV